MAVLQAMHRHQTDQAFVVIDYLQLMAKASNGLRDLGTVQASTTPQPMTREHAGAIK